MYISVHLVFIRISYCVQKRSYDKHWNQFMEINTPCLSFNVSSLHLLSYIPLLSTESTEVQVPVQGDGSGHATRGQQAGVWGVNGAVAVGGVLPGHHELLLQNRVQAVATTYWWGPPLLWWCLTGSYYIRDELCSGACVGTVLFLW